MQCASDLTDDLGKFEVLAAHGDCLWAAAFLCNALMTLLTNVFLVGPPRFDKQLAQHTRSEDSGFRAQSSECRSLNSEFRALSSEFRMLRSEF